MTATSRDPTNDRYIQRYVYGAVGTHARQSILNAVSRDVTAPIQAGVYWEVSTDINHTCHSICTFLTRKINAYYLS
jgi:hypothetical protein